MPAAAADLVISARWILPMTSRDALLEQHALVVRDGRILDVLPSALAAERYAAAIRIERPEHLLLPGLVNARSQIFPNVAHGWGKDRVVDCGLLAVAAMLRAGTSCFCEVGCFPHESARLATAQGMRAVIGIPLAGTASPWAQQPGDYLTRALNFRDEFAGHPTIATAFAPVDAAAIGDAMFGRIATLANELDAGFLISLHESAAAVDECVARHGVRPLERMQALGILTPALTGANLVHVNDGDMAVAQRSGIAITLCPASNLRTGFGMPPVAAWARSGLRLSLGTGVAPADSAADLWSDLRLLALLALLPESRHHGTATAAGSGSTMGIAADAAEYRAPGAWDALAATTCGAAAALGLDAEIGTLETGKWADVCCVDLQSPAMVQAAPGTPATVRLVFGGGRDMVSDVWVSGRHLLDGGAFTRLDWPALSARIAARPTPSMTGEI